MDAVALITGGNRGLGFATAARLGRAGATVVVGSRNVADGERAVARLRGEGLDAHSLSLDVTSSESIAAAVRAIGERHGRLDVLVNNAGILPEATAAAATSPLDVDLFRTTFETNVFAVAAVSQGFLPLLARSPAGRIVNVSSTMGSLADQGDPDSPYYDTVVPAYQASKAALNGITVALAKALRDTPITVNSVCPGWVKTDLGGPDNRAAAPLTADTAAKVVADLAAGADRRTGAFVDSAGDVAW